MIPELVGRLPCITALSRLDEEAMVRILTEPKNSVVKQYTHLFAMENATLEFTEEALRAVAIKAQKRDVGARALRSDIEELMLELMYELPEHNEDPQVYQITADMVNADAPPTLFAARKVKKESA